MSAIVEDVADTSKQGMLRAMLSRASVEVTPGNNAAQMDELKTYFPRGTDVHVAFLPNGTYLQSVETARQLREAGFNPVPHVAARAIESRAALEDFIARARGEAGVQRTLMIAGDLPEPRGPFSASIEVLETGVLQKHGLRAISVAGHPEGHPVVAADVMERALKAKLAFARKEGIEVSVITQFCFEAAPITDYVRRLRADGIAAPVRVGVAGPAGLMTLVKYGMRCGVGNSLRALRSKADIFGRLASDTPPDEILNEVAAAEAAGEIGGIAGVHFYVFGGLRKTGQWLRAALAR